MKQETPIHQWVENSVFGAVVAVDKGHAAACGADTVLLIGLESHWGRGLRVVNAHRFS